MASLFLENDQHLCERALGDVATQGQKQVFAGAK